ncbi:MAG: hypothetical protein L0Y44_04220 [Phycisphaerales bacterium]|nr:hypothetical protein [Phycisphaerales bacterium]MCI0629844.1 hypothetical protein [Phycisphaerales bacterium]MCI0675538.1 hypothetical protein [Phycisphaerales bacterium]
MAELNAKHLVAQMLGAAAKVLKKDWKESKSYAEMEFTKLAQTIVMIQTNHALGQLSTTEAKLLLDIQKNAMRSVMLTLEGLGIIAVEKAINAALKVVRDTVNSAVGFVLL